MAMRKPVGAASLEAVEAGMLVAEPPAPDAEDAYLHRVGDRVRAARAAAGLSRRELSERSGVSERYLAQLETGAGNISILLIRRIAAALGVELERLIEEEHRPDLAALIETARRLGPRQLERLLHDARGLLRRSAPERAGRIALVGLRGAGKSSLGRRLADELGVPFVELDQEIEREVGARLESIFTLYGQDAYRDGERRALASVVHRHERCVIATGGSLVVEPETYEFLRQHCFTVWLRATPEEHMKRVIAQGDMRPVRGREHAMVELRAILAQREPLYALADATVDTARRTVEDSMRALRAVIETR